MPATTTKIRDFVAACAAPILALDGHSIRIALSNTAPSAEASNPLLANNGLLANVTQIPYANYSDDMATDRQLEGVTDSEVAGVFAIDANDLTITAVGGDLAAWRYVYIYDDTAAGDPLIAVIDNGEVVSLKAGDSHILRFDAAGIVTLT